jgi:mRNA turnover protein 4
LEGNCGLLFTNRSKEEVNAYFKQFTSLEYGKAGAIPAEDIVLEIGHLPFAPGSMFDQMRKLGLTVEMDDGKIALRERFIAAKTGVPLTPEQAKLLVHMNKPIIPFTIELKCFWTDGKYEDL